MSLQTFMGMEKMWIALRKKRNQNWTYSMILKLQMLFVETGLNVESGYLWVRSMNDCYFLFYSFKISYHRHVLFLCSGKMLNLQNSEKIS